MTGLNLAQPDITLRLDDRGVIKEIALSDQILEHGVQALVGQSWEATVGDVGGAKIRQMLKQAHDAGVSAFRQINQQFPSGAELPIEFATIRLGGRGGIVAIGKNLQTVAELQSKLVAAQQAMERDYWSFREIETRYRMLFDTSAEAVVVVRGVDLSIIEANPAARRALGTVPDESDFLTLLPAAERDPVRAMLERVRDQGRAPGVLVHLNAGAEPWMLRASPMNAASGPVYLLQLAPVGSADPERTDEPAGDVDALIEGLPDGFVMIDADGVVMRSNKVFLDLVQIGSDRQVVGERLSRWLGRPGADLPVLLDNVDRHGLVRLFATTLHGELGAETEVEIAAAGHATRGDRHYVLAMRDVGSRLAATRAPTSPAFVQSAVTRPVGSAPLRDLVGDTVGLIERHYIETALDLTGGNRKAAAALLGLSRQGLYAKLARYGVGSGDASEDETPG